MTEIHGHWRGSIVDQVSCQHRGRHSDIPRRRGTGSAGHATGVAATGDDCRSGMGSDIWLRRILHLALDAGAISRIFHALDPRFKATRPDPRWHRGIEPCSAGGVGIHIGGDSSTRIPTSPRYDGPPVPSKIRPRWIARSNSGAAAQPRTAKQMDSRRSTARDSADCC